MIGRLRGILVGRSAVTLTVEVAGVGYEVQVTPRTQSSLPGIGEELVVHTHLHGREDGLILYGFASESERNLFRDRGVQDRVFSHRLTSCRVPVARPGSVRVPKRRNQSRWRLP